MTHTERITIEDLLSATPLDDPATHLDRQRVAFYAGHPHPDQLPPVVAVRGSDGFLLVDGYHRLAAARQRGDTHLVTGPGPRRAQGPHPAHVRWR